MIAGPGSCAVSCVSAQSAIGGMVAACNGGLTDDCRERVGSDHHAGELARALPQISAKCRATPRFDVSSTYVQFDWPWDITADLGGKMVAGDCDFDRITIVLQGHPLAWRVVDTRPGSR